LKWILSLKKERPKYIYIYYLSLDKIQVLFFKGVKDKININNKIFSFIKLLFGD